MPSSLASRAAGSQVSVKSERHRETFQAGLKSFINEARLLASFDHPSLLKVYRFWEANGTAYMVMPFLEGMTLKDRLREMGEAPDEAWLRSMLGPLTEALMVIHAEQCYHRDIAPDNVMLLAGSQRPLLMDFGASRRVIGDMTQALTVILKPGYAPVEQYAEIPGMKQGAWTDVYALAAVVYFSIMRKTPPPSVGRLLKDTYVPLAQAAAGRYGEAFLSAIDRALAVKPEERTHNIQQLREELGLGPVATGDPYTTQPLPLSAGVPARPAAAVAPSAPSAPSAPILSSSPTRALSPPETAGSAEPLRESGATSGVTGAVRSGTKSGAISSGNSSGNSGGNSGAKIGIGAGVVVLGALAFGVYSWLAPAGRPAPAPTAVVANVAEGAAAAAAPASAVAAAPTAAPAAPVAAAPAGLDPWTEFDRLVQGQTPGFGVKAVAARTTLRIDKDEIAFTVDAERDGYLYVFAYGADRALVQLLPNTVSNTPRVKKGQTFRFPMGDRVVLNASDPPGPGRLVVMVAARQRDHRELEPKSEGTFRFFPVGAEAGAIVARHAGPQPLLAGRAICPASGACDESYGAAVMQMDVVK